VARPSLTVSADKMNVFYTGVENPVSISVPGIANENVTVSIDNGTITRTGDGKYSVKVFNGTKAIIRVSGKMQDGESRSMGSVEYRVKQLPDPIPGIGHQKGSGKIPYSELIAQQGMYVAYDDNFEFKASAQIYSFKMIITTVNGDLSLNSDGPRFTQQMKDAMKKLRRGNKVYFENIVAEGPDKKKRDLTMTLTIQ
jgi:gliding motility-associated protein GldM